MKKILITLSCTILLISCKTSNVTSTVKNDVSVSIDLVNVTDDKVNHCRDRKVDQDFDQGIDLVFLANCAQFQEGKSCVHGQHHDAAQQNKERIRALF